FICYALTYRAANAAGYNIPKEYEPDDYTWFNEVPAGSVEAGDIVLYDWEDDGSYDHIGIIADVTAGQGVENELQYPVVNCIGIVEHFQFGAAEKRLGIFGSEAYGGDFSSWNPLWEEWDYAIYRLE
ncbi:MAG TPA: hypothetical protein VMX58_02545, partial [Patescibacteria group bacterium]|nr:hypothetical protein [Patescibacteria group bacterium]